MSSWTLRPGFCRLKFFCTPLVALISIGLMLLSPAARAVVGRTPGTFTVSPIGAATYTIPIWAPPGPHELQPNIALVYNSEAGNGDIGVGWSLSGLGSIGRCNQTYAQDGAPGPVTLTLSDVFCINGQRLRLTSGTYGEAGSTYQTEIADFTNVTAYGAAGNGPAYFVVQDRIGRTYTYGSGGSSQVLANGTSTALSWLLSEVSDPEGNTMTVAYTAGVGTAVPSTISWAPTSHGANIYAYTMTFAYGANVAQSSIYGYVASTSVENTNLLGSITVAYSGTTVKKYVLTYKAAPVTARNELVEVQECADSGATNCLAPSTFTYQGGALGVGSVTSLGASAGQTSGPYTAYDLNGDGINDLVWYDSEGMRVSFGSSTGFAAPISTGITTAAVAIEDIDGSGVDSILTPVNGDWWVYKWDGSTFVGSSTGIAVDETGAGTFALADLNGDGLPDLVTTRSDGYLYIRLNTSAPGSFSFSSTATKTIENQWPQGITSFAGGTRRFDFYGSGQQDLITYYTSPGPPVSTTVYAIHFNGSTFVVTAVSSGYGLVDIGDYNDDGCTDVLTLYSLNLSPCQGASGTSVTLPGMAVAGIDWDSDGRRDILVVDGSALEVFLSNGTGFQSTGIATSIPYGAAGDYQYGTIHNATGDGQDALAVFSNTSPYTVEYYLHNGAGQSPDLLSNVIDGYGNSVSPTYVSIVQGVNSYYFQQTAPQYPYKAYLGPLYVVNTATFSDPSSATGGTYSQSHYYAGAQMNQQGRGFAGFHAHQIQDSRNNVYETLDYNLAFPYTGMLVLDYKTENNLSNEWH